MTLKLSSKEIASKVEIIINELISEFKQYPDKFLTEEDVRAYLYHLLLEAFDYVEKTEDGEHSIPLHTEIRWYGNSGTLKLRSDIVIFEVSTLKTKNKESVRLPSKGYEFDIPYVLIEIKLRRNRKGSDNRFKKKILQDRDKIEKIRSEINEPFYSYLIAFDKKANMSFECKNTDNHKEFYISSRND